MKFARYLKYKWKVHKFLKQHDLSSKQNYEILCKYSAHRARTRASVNRLNHYQRVNKRNMRNAIAKLATYDELSDKDKKQSNWTVSKIAKYYHVARSSLYREFDKYKRS